MEILNRIKAIEDLFYAETDRVIDIDKSWYNGRTMLRVMFAEQPSFINIDDDGIVGSLTESGQMLILEKIVDDVIVMWPEEVKNGKEIQTAES